MSIELRAMFSGTGVFSTDIVSMELFHKVLSCYVCWFGFSGLGQAGYPDLTADVCRKDPALAHWIQIAGNSAPSERKEPLRIAGN
ncbi:hypothetical protein C9993_04705 [Marinobacter sp. Z-F4-2]|nr:hypothetical protein C9993_04705 [Marinobacter sp. Z-F4-2]